MRACGRRADAAFSLLELGVVILVLAILGVLAVPALAKLRQRAQRVQCIANLKSLSVAAEQFVQQNGMWPQVVPPAAAESSMQSFAQEWIAALKPFGATEKTWICPTIQNFLGNPDYLQPLEVRIDYMPMMFDDKPTTPHEWPRFPWFMETGNEHGSGPLVIFTDGSVSDMDGIIAKASSAPR